MLTIKTTGFEDYLDGSANIKTLIIGGPGAGKTRYSSFWPKPFLIDCEDGRGSVADRAMPYVRVRSSKDMLDVLEYLKGLESTPKAQRRHQTVIVDTADSFQRIVKDEWVTANKAGVFSGFDAWGYLDTKMQLLFTRLLNLDYNVLVLVHYKDKTYKEGDNTIRELTLQLQGAISDQIFNDFGLVGWMGTYWEAGEDGRVQKRGLTFQPTPEKPFLKDRFHITAPWMPVTFTEADYTQLFDAFTNRADIEELPEAAEVGQVPDAPTTTGPVAPPREGGPVARPAAAAAPTAPAAEAKEAPADTPLSGMTVKQLSDKAKALGLTVRGNTLKAELISMIEALGASPASSPAPTESSPSPSTPTTQSDDPWAPPPTTSPSAAPSSKSDASPSADAPPAVENASAEEGDAVALLGAELGAEVISETTNDAPSTPQAATPSTPVAQPTTSAPQGPSACADCGADLAPFWADAQAKGVVRMSFIKHRRYLCPPCHEKN